MLDGLYKSKIDLFWNYLGKAVVYLGLTPNQVTWLGLGFLSINCLLYIWHEDTLVFGIVLVFIFALDSLDGAVARLTDSSTLYGGYLDAVVDRYQEVIVYMTIALVHDYWEVCFVAITASLLISYNKARTAIEKPVENNNWPDLLERLERVIILCAGLIFNQWILLPDAVNFDFLFLCILIIALLGHVTAIQRFLRARKHLITDTK